MCLDTYDSIDYYDHTKAGNAGPDEEDTMTAIEKARAEVNRMQFGTDEWEAAMEKVRELVEAENASTDFGRHTSIDGDIWSA